RYVGVSSHHGRDPAVEVPTHGDFLRGRLRVHIDQHNLFRYLPEKIVDHPERVVIAGHKHASLQVDDGIRNLTARFPLIQTPARQGGRVICWPEEAPSGTVRISIRGLEVFDDLPLVPNVVSRAQHFNSSLEQFLRQGWSNTKTSSCVLAIGNDQVSLMLGHKL